MNLDQNFYLDVLTLLIYTMDEDAMHISKQALAQYATQMNGTATPVSIQAQAYVEAIKSLLQENVDLNIESEVEVLLAKIGHTIETDSSIDLVTIVRTLIANKSKIHPIRIKRLKDKLSNALLCTVGKRCVSGLFNKIAKASSSTDAITQSLLIEEFLDTARNIVGECKRASLDTNSLVEEFSFDDKESLIKTFESFNADSTNKDFVSGLQGLNEMLGGGASLGEFCSIAALSGHFKSGFLNAWLRWIATLNKPVKRSGKPCIVFISLENEIKINLRDWYYDYSVNTLGKEPDIGLSSAEMAEIVMRAYETNGWCVKVYRRMAHQFDFEDWVKIHTDLDSNGYDVQVSILDYMTLMKPETSVGGTAAEQYEALATRLGNYANHKRMLTITGLQLNGKASELSNSGYEDAVKKYSELHLAKSKGIKNALDVLIFSHIEYNESNEKFWTIAINKHKYEKPVVPLAQRYCAYKFEQFGILDDNDTVAKFTRNIRTGDGDSTKDLFSDDF